MSQVVNKISFRRKIAKSYIITIILIIKSSIKVMKTIS